MTKSDDELRQQILNRRARFVAAAMCTSGVVFSACSNGSSDPIVGTIGQAPAPATSASSSGPTPCLTTATPPPTACLAAPFPGPCLSIVVPPPTGTPVDTITTAPVDTEPRVCLSPPYPTIDPGPTLVVESSAAALDGGVDAAVETNVVVNSDVANSDVATNAASESVAPADNTELGAGVDASVEPFAAP